MPDDVTVTSRSLRRGDLLEVRVNPEDLGRVIGRSGRTARALRTVVGALADSPVRVDVVDTVGAGDSFAGAFCHRILEGDSMADAAAFASRVGAFSVTRPGAQPSYPSVGDELPKL